MQAASSPQELRESRIKQLEDWALQQIAKRGPPTNYLSFVEFVAREAHARFRVTWFKAQDYAGIACRLAMDKYELAKKAAEMRQQYSGGD